MHGECRLSHNIGRGIGAEGKNMGPGVWTGGMGAPHLDVGISGALSVQGSAVQGRGGAHQGVWVTMVCNRQPTCTRESFSGGSSVFSMWARGGADGDGGVKRVCLTHRENVFERRFAWRASCLTNWYQSQTSGVGCVVGGREALT